MNNLRSERLNFLLLFNIELGKNTEFFATLQHWIGGKEDNMNVKVDFFGVTFLVFV